jgi:hypothetical protein
VEHFYVIAPVGSDPEYTTKRAMLSEAAAPFGVVPLFPLDRSPLVAMERATNDIRNARFVLADLTFERPSCYFELGLAEATGVDVSIIAKAGTSIHQVGYASQVNFYRDLDHYKSVITNLLHSKLSNSPRQPLRAAHT